MTVYRCVASLLLTREGEQIQKFLTAEVLDSIWVRTDEGVCNSRFSCLYCQNLLFECAFRSKTVNGYVTLLSNAVCAVYSLLVVRRVPVVVVHDDRVGPNEIQSSTARLSY